MTRVVFNNEAQLYTVSLELTFLTNGRALAPYEISESTTAGEHDNVPARLSTALLKKKNSPR